MIVASLAKERLDIIDRVPSLLEEEIDEAVRAVAELAK